VLTAAVCLAATIRSAMLEVGARCPMIITSRSDTERVKFRALGLAVRSVASP
jgi:hypothetical protein